MKNYSFAPISAREYPSVKILDHPYIWGGVSFCINVSEEPYSSELVEAMKGHGIEWLHLPISEDLGSDWSSMLERALPKMYEAYKTGKKQVVHCDFGNNRSRTFVEALYYLLTGEQFQDEYKGEVNHLAYNCKRGHLPPLEQTEGQILQVGLDIHAKTGSAPEWVIAFWDWYRNAVLDHVKHRAANWKCGTPLRKRKQNDT